MTKTLFVVISDQGDGSFYPKFTFDKNLIEKMGTPSKEPRDWDYNPIGWDGDGFHFAELSLPDECTSESLGITSSMLDENNLSYS